MDPTVGQLYDYILLNINNMLYMPNAGNIYTYYVIYLHIIVHIISHIDIAQ